MRPDYILKKGDLLPPLQTQLRYSNGNPISLVGATEIRFRMRSLGSTINLIDKTAGITVDDAPNGRVSYAWVTGDTATVGDYMGEFSVNDGLGKSISIPNGRFIRVVISEGLR